jgi:hypothetical protein
MNAHDVAVPPAFPDTGALNTLLRGELSAVESYDRVLPEFERCQATAELHRIRDAHSEAVAVLRERVVRGGGVPAEGPGPWPAFVAVVGGAAKALGPATVLRALHEGEVLTAGEYEAALNAGQLDAETAGVVRSQLLPRSREHVVDLDRLLGGK